jgi:hypothetical protein
MHFCLENCEDTSNWTEVPGKSMTAEGDNWFVYENDEWSGYVEFVFNDGSGTWDNNSEENYSTDLQEFWVKNGKITDKDPDAEEPDKNQETPDSSTQNDSETNLDDDSVDDSDSKGSGCGCTLVF